MKDGNSFINWIKKHFVKEYWANQNRYVGMLCVLLTLAGGIYLLIHNMDVLGKKQSHSGHELVKLNSDMLNHINAIIESNLDTTYQADTVMPKEINNNVSTEGINRIIAYISFNFPTWEKKNRILLRNDLLGLSKSSVISYLGTIRISIASFFWLNSDWTYVEIFFWAIFGVIVSLLYSITEAIRNKDPNINFDPNQIPSHFAKLFYAPIITIVIIFVYSYATGNTGADLSVSKMILVVSFLLGFYSGRAMDLLNRVKELLLPYSADKTSASAGPKYEDKTGKKITINLELANAEIPPDVDYEDILNQLGAAIVKLVDKSTGNEISLSKTGEDQEGLYVAENVIGNNYKLDVRLNTAENLSFSYEADIDLSKADIFEIQLKKDTDAG